MNFLLPAAFIWGVSASGYQSEGGNVDSNWDRYNAASVEMDRYGTSVDFRHRYREDIALAHDLGVNTFRIGIDWARVERKPGQFDETELAYYDDVIRAMKEAGIAPLITLDHFVYPGWVADQGAWTNAKTVDDFERFSQMIFERYHDDVKLWLTFNEAAFFIMIEKRARKMSWSEMLDMRRNVIKAHRDIYDRIKARDPKAMVTSNIVWCGEGFLSTLLQWFTDWLFLDGTDDKMDSIAFDYYYPAITWKFLQGKIWETPLDGSGVGRAARKLAQRYPKLPILVAENGMPTPDGKPRPDGVRREDELRAAVASVQRAKADGVNVVGYMYWSLTDNFEWGHYGPRFGLYTVDVLTDPKLERKPTAAVGVYRDIIRAGGVAEPAR